MPDDANDYPLGPALDFMQRVSQLNHALEKLSSRMDLRLGVTAQQRLIIRCIGKYPSITAGRLARILHVDAGTVSAALRRLERKGLISRRNDPRDKRRTLLGLTAAGRMLDSPAPGTVESSIERLLETAPADDIALTVQVLGQLTSFLEDALQEGGIAGWSL